MHNSIAFSYAVVGGEVGSAVGQPPSGVLMNASCATIVLVKLAIKQFSFVQDRNAPLAMDLTVVGMVNCSSALLNARNWLGMFVNEVGITIDAKLCTSKNTFPTYCKRENNTLFI